MDGKALGKLEGTTEMFICYHYGMWDESNQKQFAVTRSSYGSLRFEEINPAEED